MDGQSKDKDKFKFVYSARPHRAAELKKRKVKGIIMIIKRSSRRLKDTWRETVMTGLEGLTRHKTGSNICSNAKSWKVMQKVFGQFGCSELQVFSR